MGSVIAQLRNDVVTEVGTFSKLHHECLQESQIEMLHLESAGDILRLLVLLHLSEYEYLLRLVMLPVYE